MSTHTPDPGEHGPDDNRPDDRSQQRAWDAIVADLSSDPSFALPNLPVETSRPAADADDEYVPSPWEAYLDEGYEPPEPPPIELPRHPVARFGWVGVIGGPLLVIGSNVLGSGSATLSGIGVIAFIAGFVALVSRLGGPRNDDEDGGAVV